ncbi:MAG: helix-hairpin-helix domain-containing protein [Gammaproteobacteria bacterium]|nr:helix-hairpin-helix domain-containing protein [Gammaproteobacteria bacterium]NNM01871.1 helix-hairpin-helix domain-containing protein [Gammaproteobacteria bacterium]
MDGIRIRAPLAALLCAVALLVTGAERIDVNTAAPEELANALSGVGLAKAEAIVAYRKQFGPFRSIDDLLLVRGIGSAILEQNRDRIDVGAD